MAALTVDHLVYVSADLDAATAELESRLGVRPAGGGSHVGRGTRNSLLSLGGDVYLEVIGPDPAQEVQQPASRFADPPLLRTWAVKAPEIDVTVARARERGYDPGDVNAMSRARPDGVLLEWRLTSGGGGGLGTDGSVGLVPFLIDWGETEHPALSTPTGCTLVSLRAEHPDPGAVLESLEALGVELAVEVGPVAALIATIDTPRGRIELR
jgi:Glyoxalase-like domain